MDQDIVSMNVRIQGEVQGVGFRDFAVREATTRGLKGWVRNRSDGTVEILACGLRSEVELFIATCVSGPRGSKVTSFDLAQAELPALPGFTRRPNL